jgi:quinol monooxygenase YgiN
VILIVAKFRPRPELADEWPALMEPFTAATRAEPGNRGFDWFRHTEDPGLYVLIETFADGAAGEEHVSSEHFQAAIAQLASLLAETPEIIHVEVPGAGWSEMGEVTVPPGA